MKHTIGCTTRPYGSLIFAEACVHIAAAGYTDVAVYSNDGKVPIRSDSSKTEIAETRKAAADAGLAPSMGIGGPKLNLGLEAAIEDYKRLLDNTAEVGAKWQLNGGTSNEAHYDDFYEVMRQTAPHAESVGLKITLKPHGGITLTDEDLIRAHNEVNHPAFGISYDPGNIIYYTKGECRPETNIPALAPTVSTVIIKDCVVEDDNPDVMVTPGEGLVDFEKVLGGLVAEGFVGPLYVECVGGKTVDEINANVKSTLIFVSDILT